jgi:hypothetical protein
MKLMKELILNGPDKHPGANFVEQRGQAFKKALRFVNRNKVAQELKVRNVFGNCNIILLDLEYDEERKLLPIYLLFICSLFNDAFSIAQAIQHQLKE